MQCLTGAAYRATGARPGRLRAGLVSVACFVRNVPLFFAAAPATPLRVLCVVALDTVHVLRSSQPLSRQRRIDMAAFLDFQACTNAAWDRKPLCAEEYEAMRRRVQAAGLEGWMTDYLFRLGELESRRPPIGGDSHRFAEVRAYREDVARLSLATIAAIALEAETLNDAIRATQCDADVAALFRMAMQCQIVDDVFDYREDLAGGLPSFLTACASLPEALMLTARAARSYAAAGRCSTSGGVFPLAVALYVLTLVTSVVIAAARTRQAGARRPGRHRRTSPAPSATVESGFSRTGDESATRSDQCPHER